MLKPELDSFMRKFYRFLDQGHNIHFRRLKDAHGIIWKYQYPTTVIFDPRKELFATIIHEAIHYIHPDLSETNVLKYEREVVNALSERRIRNILKRFAQVL
jgi:hypothetical protein